MLIMIISDNRFSWERNRHRRPLSSVIFLLVIGFLVLTVQARVSRYLPRNDPARYLSKATKISEEQVQGFALVQDPCPEEVHQDSESSPQLSFSADPLWQRLDPLLTPCKFRPPPLRV